MDLGRIFHFVLPEGNHKGACRPFIVVQEWSYGMANGLVFLDGGNDALDDVGNTIKPPVEGEPWPESANVAWFTSVGRSKVAQTRTWHRWEDCPKNRPVDEPLATGPTFINSERDLVNGNPALTHVFNAGGVEIPWPQGMTLSQALKAWARQAREAVAATSGQV